DAVQEDEDRPGWRWPGGPVEIVEPDAVVGREEAALGTPPANTPGGSAGATVSSSAVRPSVGREARPRLEGEGTESVLDAGGWVRHGRQCRPATNKRGAAPAHPALRPSTRAIRAWPARGFVLVAGEVKNLAATIATMEQLGSQVRKCHRPHPGPGQPYYWTTGRSDARSSASPRPRREHPNRHGGAYPAPAGPGDRATLHHRP